MTLRIPYLRRLFLVFCLLITIASSARAAGPAPQGYLVYVGTYTDHGSKGIYAYRFDSSTGKLISLGLAAEADEPSFVAVDSSGRYLFAVNEIANYNGQPTGA